MNARMPKRNLKKELLGKAIIGGQKKMAMINRNKTMTKRIIKKTMAEKETVANSIETKRIEMKRTKARLEKITAEKTHDELHSQSAPHHGRITRVFGSVVIARPLTIAMNEIVRVGEQKLLGEVIRINGDTATIQLYEDSAGLRPGEPVIGTGHPLTVELGPGLLSNVFDGIQRPLPSLVEEQGAFMGCGAVMPSLDRKKRWRFNPAVRDGMQVTGGQRIGYIEEFAGFKHHIMVPPGLEGTVRSMQHGDLAVDQVLCEIIGATPSTTGKVRMMQSWPVRTPRPIARKHTPTTPLITGQRVVDALFPVAKGGTAIVSGPFGSGKTVLQHQLAKWSDADIIVYVGCGERGNEMTEVLVEFPRLKDPRNGKPLMQRTALIANTSNMPVAAREASVYTGATIAEYFRDMGYDVALMADSTSRWAEALREISSRLGEMPVEEGYPAYLTTRIAEFYERAGVVATLGATDDTGDAAADTTGSLTIIGAVSPPGGDFFEPVTQASLRVVKTFWALDARIAQQRHFPSINWLNAYSLYRSTLRDWYDKNAGPAWNNDVTIILSLLQEESRLLEIVRLVGSDALPDSQRFTLHAARLIREGFLQQEARNERETYCPLTRTQEMLRALVEYHTAGAHAIARGASVQDIVLRKVDVAIFSLRHATDDAFEASITAIKADIAAIEGIRTGKKEPEQPGRDDDRGDI